MTATQGGTVLDPAWIAQFHVTLCQPLLATKLAGDPNEGVSFDYIPGSLLRGILIHRYCQEKKIPRLDVVGEEAQRLFFNGQTRFLNAYPLRDGQRLLPVPRSLQCPKYYPQALTDWAMHTATEEDQKVDWKSVPEPFCLLKDEKATLQGVLSPALATRASGADEPEDELEEDDGWSADDDDYDPDSYGAEEAESHVRLHGVKRQIWVHTARTRRFGRAMPRQKLGQFPEEFQGAVYRYDALAPEQTFAALILCQTAEDAACLRRLLGAPGQEAVEITLGGARSAGYGKAKLHDAAILSEQAWPKAIWRECGGPELSGGAGPGDELRLTFLSDALLRDANGQGCVSPDALEAVLRVRLGPMTLVRDRTFLAATPSGGFNNTWGLPLPQLPAVQSGSVVTLRAGAEIPLEKLQQLEAQGLGERRAEGFGRVAVNWHNTAGPPVRNFDDEKPPPPQWDAVSRALAQDMVERMLRCRLAERVLELAYDDDHMISGLRSRSQIARLRSVIGHQLAQEYPAIAPVRAFIRDIRNRASARRQLERARLQHRHQSLLDWLDSVLQLPESAEGWEDRFKVERPSLGVVTAPELAATQSVTAMITEELRTEYVLRLADAVLGRAAKEWQGNDGDTPQSTSLDTVGEETTGAKTGGVA